MLRYDIMNNISIKKLGREIRKSLESTQFFFFFPKDTGSFFKRRFKQFGCSGSLAVDFGGFVGDVEAFVEMRCFFRHSLSIVRCLREKSRKS